MGTEECSLSFVYNVGGRSDEVGKDNGSFVERAAFICPARNYSADDGSSVVSGCYHFLRSKLWVER